MSTRALTADTLTPEQLRRVKEFLQLAREATDIAAMARDSQRSAESDLAAVLASCIPQGDSLHLSDMGCTVQWLPNATNGQPIAFVVPVRR